MLFLMPLLLQCGFGVLSSIGFGGTRGLELQEGYLVQAVWVGIGSWENGAGGVEPGSVSLASVVLVVVGGWWALREAWSGSRGSLGHPP